MAAADGCGAESIRARSWLESSRCGTCAIGRRAADGVLGSDFRVHGTAGLRVVDASAFPRIPGYFIAAAGVPNRRKGDRHDPRRRDGLKAENWRWANRNRRAVSGKH
jgi:hypothetical protein